MVLKFDSLTGSSFDNNVVSAVQVVAGTDCQNMVHVDDPTWRQLLYTDGWRDFVMT